MTRPWGKNQGPSQLLHGHDSWPLACVWRVSNFQFCGAAAWADTLPTPASAGHQWTIPTSRGHSESYFSQWEPLFAMSVGTLRSQSAPYW